MVKLRKRNHTVKSVRVLEPTTEALRSVRKLLRTAGKFFHYLFLFGNSSGTKETNPLFQYSLADQQFVNGQCQQCPGTYDYNSLESAQAGQPCQQHKYCRFPGYDCDSINHNTFYGSCKFYLIISKRSKKNLFIYTERKKIFFLFFLIVPDWLNVPGAKETSGNEILAGSGASDGESERYCLNTFPDS